MVKIDFLLTFQIKNTKLASCIQSYCKKHVIQAYYQKIDFIEKTCPNYDLSTIWERTNIVDLLYYRMKFG